MLKECASAIHGSDAIASVVKAILRCNFTITSVAGSIGQTK